MLAIAYNYEKSRLIMIDLTKPEYSGRFYHRLATSPMPLGIFSLISLLALLSLFSPVSVLVMCGVLGGIGMLHQTIIQFSLPKGRPSKATFLQGLNVWCLSLTLAIVFAFFLFWFLNNLLGLAGHTVGQYYLMNQLWVAIAGLAFVFNVEMRYEISRTVWDNVPVFEKDEIANSVILCYIVQGIIFASTL